VYNISFAASMLTGRSAEKMVFSYVLYYFKIYTCLAALYLIHVSDAVQNEYKSIFTSAIISLLLSTINFDFNKTSDFVLKKMKISRVSSTKGTNAQA
tara:strand:- start:8963 stop:9253 length:291 start_codon:yes stop_codon:yes gene_type:complete